MLLWGVLFWFCSVDITREADEAVRRITDERGYGVKEAGCEEKA